jgi:16S rRNA (uracil1498-N3)-methyltransferase
MHRFYIEEVYGDEVVMAGDQLHHLRDVLRLKIGDEVIIFDSQGKEYTGLVTGLDKRQASLKLIPIESHPADKTRLTVACAVPRGKVMDDIVDYLTQLGVDNIIPVLTERVVVRLDEKTRETRRERWEKIALSAARQSRRNNIPRIEPVTKFEKVVSLACNYELKLIPTLAGDTRHLKDTLSSIRPKSIFVLIGPEGDFTREEVQLALDNDFISISLGGTVLRVATAAIAVTGYIKLALGE